MIISPNLGLTIWNLGSDPYNHEELAENWIRIDNHAHTGGEDGKKIGTAALEDGSVTGAKLAPGAIPPLAITNGSIVNAHLANDAVSTAKIQDGAVTEQKLAGGISIPIGGIIPYGGTTAPSGWQICDGSPLSRTTYSTLFGIVGTAYGTGDGSTTFNVPDFRGRVAVGVNSSNGTVATRGASDSLALGSRTLVHGHAVSALSVAAHSHTMSHRHSHIAPVAVNSSTGEILVIKPSATFLDAGDGSYKNSGPGTGAITGGTDRSSPLTVQTSSTTLDRWRVESSTPVDTSGAAITNTGSATAGVNGTTDNASGAYLAVNYIIRHGV